MKFAKIYRLKPKFPCGPYTPIYGYTTAGYLNTRLSSLKYIYKKYIKGELINCHNSFKLFFDYGLNNILIELVETYPYQHRDELEKRKKYYTDNCEIVFNPRSFTIKFYDY